MSCLMRENLYFFCMCEKKGADQLHGIPWQRISTFDKNSPSYIWHFKPLVIFCGCTAWYVLDLVGNPKDKFSYDRAQIV